MATLRLLLILIACSRTSANGLPGLHFQDGPSIGSGFDPAPFAPFGAPRSLLTDSPYRGLPMPPLAFPFQYPAFPSFPFFPPPPVPPPYGFPPFGGPSPFGIPPPPLPPQFPFFYPPPPLPYAYPPPPPPLPAPPLPAGPAPAPIIVPAKTAAALSVASLIHALIARKFYPPVLPFPVPNPIPLPVPVKIPVPVDRPVPIPLSEDYNRHRYHPYAPQFPPQHQYMPSYAVPRYPEHQHYRDQHPPRYYDRFQFSSASPHSIGEHYGQEQHHQSEDMIFELRPPIEEQNEFSPTVPFSQDSRFNEIVDSTDTSYDGELMQDQPKKGTP